MPRRGSRRTLILIVATVIALAASATPVTATPRFASGRVVGGAVHGAHNATYYRTVVSSTSVGADFAHSLGSCQIASRNTSCSVGYGETATRTISLSLGASWSAISSQLGISSASSTTVTTSCTWTSIGLHYAYPRGKHIYYKIQKWYSISNTRKLLDTSSTLHAFDPYSTSIYCGS